MFDAGNRFDLLFTDIGLPGGINGFELASQACQRQHDLKRLFTTGYGNNGDRTVTRRARCNTSSASPIAATNWQPRFEPHLLTASSTSRLEKNTARKQDYGNMDTRAVVGANWWASRISGDKDDAPGAEIKRPVSASLRAFGRQRRPS